MYINCRHCQSRIRPAIHREWGIANYAGVLAIIAAAVFISPLFFFGGWIPFCFPNRYHVCPACKLRLD